MSSIRRHGPTGRIVKAPDYAQQYFNQKTGVWVLKKNRNPCQHDEVHEIGQDHDKDGNPTRLIRCQSCGLLMREYYPILSRCRSKWPTRAPRDLREAHTNLKLLVPKRRDRPDRTRERF